MDALRSLIDVFLHVDRHLADIVANYGLATYAILFAIVFCETGLVVTPFLPGDSLLFAAGALCGPTELSIGVLLPVLMGAAILGDAVNYWIGFLVGPGFLAKGKVRFVKREHLERTQRFYERHGGKTIILARFVPIMRTFAPFVAGIGRMSPVRFFAYNIVGGILWVTSFTLLGFFFGSMPVVKHNFSLVVFGIIGLSVVPLIFKYFQSRRSSPDAS
jgi:membrane-associated protein